MMSYAIGGETAFYQPPDPCDCLRCEAEGIPCEACPFCTPDPTDIALMEAEERGFEYA